MDLKEARLGRGPQVQRHPWELARLEVVRTLLRPRFEERAIPAPGVLDVGCGDGFVVAALAAEHRALRFAAVDAALTPSDADELTRRLALANLSFHTSIEAAGLQPDSIGLILLLDVLEHIESDAAFLRDLVRHPCAAAGASVLITVPACAFLFGEHDRFLGHYRRYDVPGLRRTVQEAGLHVVGAGTFFASLVPARMLSVIRQRMMPGSGAGRPGVADWKGGRLLSRLLCTVLRADFHLCRTARRCGLTLPGLSCYAICQERAS